MENQITTIRFNKRGDQIVETKQTGDGVVQTIKFGMIKLIGDKEERRVSFKTLLDIERAQREKFHGTIAIPELNMTTPADRVVMLRSETEQVRKVESFTNLPTALVILTEGLTISPKIRLWHTNNLVPFYQAKLHYREGEEGREYIMDIEKIPELIKIEFRDGCPVITQIIKYGERIRE